jgi:hypothetical protein
MGFHGLLQGHLYLTGKVVEGHSRAYIGVIPRQSRGELRKTTEDLSQDGFLAETQTEHVENKDEKGNNFNQLPR